MINHNADPLPATVRGAGILFITGEGHALFLKRGPGGDHPGEWCFPGGTTEAGEQAIDTAIRESIEEIGFLPEGTRSELARNISLNMNGVRVDFTTFMQRIDAEFVPTINGEHVGYAWAPVDQPPEPLHPGCRIALDRLNMDELGVARAICDGRLTSPQKYGNVWLFDLRITGTGVAYRRKLNEFVFRRPENYLTGDFLARCNGLAVIWYHPPKRPVMNSEDFNERIIGAMMLPYIKGEEVWGIAKVYDADAVSIMLTEQLSTSPAVILGGVGSDIKMTLEDGANLIIEGKAYLFDHLAICERGVWDKGGEPSGVIVETLTGDLAMTEEEKKAAEEKARKDADVGTKLDTMLAKLDSMTSRMDAYETREKERCDADEKARKDADEKKAAEEKERADADALREKGDPLAAVADANKRSDAAISTAADAAAGVTAMSGRLDTIAAMLPRARTDAEFADLAMAQSKADAVFQAFGERAPRPADNEPVMAYRRRVAGQLKTHSKTWEKVDLSVFADSDAFSPIEQQIYNDATAAAYNPDLVPVGGLREIKKTLPGGHTEITFVGHPQSWMDRFASSKRFVTKIDNMRGGATAH